MKSPTIPEVEPQFEKEIDPFQQPSFCNPFQAQVIKCETPTLSARCRSSIFEETLTPDPSVCRWLLDIISEDEHITKESVHFTLYGSSKFNTIGLINEVKNIENLKSTINEAPEPYNRDEIDEMLDIKLNISDQINAYTKTEDDALLLLKADKSELIDTYSKTKDDELLGLKLNISDQIDAHNKIKVDALLDNKLDVSDQIDAYIKQEDDALMLLKVDKSELIDAYSKTEADAPLDEKLNISDQIDAYTQQEDDALLIFKADKSELADYVNLGTNQTITGQKQFNIITVASVSKQGKNDASIFLAGGGDMLVSSLVNQTELQEVRGIASGKSKAYVFDTQSDLNDWMAIQDNVAKLVIGDNLYIIDKQVVDYWWDGTDLKVLETEQPDMANVITTLITATGGGNAIGDLLFSGNTLIPAKNINFVTADYDQNISGSKTFTRTIHFIGIQVQNYDNLSVVLAGGGVKAIQDINASVDLSNYYNKSQTYSQTETDQKLNLKLNISDQIDAYSKTQDDALLLLKADNTELIDAYNKTEIDVLLDNKLNISDQIDANTKMQDDALLLLKADRTQLIDAYTKGETNNLLNNKADSGEDDALLLLKAYKTQLIDAYTKGETNNLLSINADSGVSYTKGEDDALLLLKANQSQTYIKTETDQLISQIEVGNVDLSGYMALGTSQTITANKTFNNACRFVSSIDGMATITGTQFVKSGADDTVVLLGAGGTKPISEFAGTPTDLSDYYIKIQTYLKTETDNKFERLEGSIQQIIIGRLKYVGPFGQTYDETQDPVANTYLTMSEVDSKLTNYVNTANNQEINGTKTFNANVNATGFVKTGKDYTSVLLAGGDDQLLSSFGGVHAEDITNLVVNLYSNIIFNYLKLTRISTFYTLMMEIQPKTQINTSTQTIICTVGNSSTGISPPTPPSTTYPISLATKRKTLTCIYSYRDFRITTDSTEAWGINDDVGLQLS
ncbi:MAG: hypothetical protein EZS28_002505 [Streblomastix strix]|uniref:Uncharacterized protein n=1 Tax=Streblomastix strix TaxID=222440 RepID=A0A5J4X3V9_9EUKA|nr:MAG: hypothetical protein EZS28_002505 [Streblomastix strix]